MSDYGFNTALLHAADQENQYGATLVPIYQSSAFSHESAEELERIFENKAMGYSYTRINNPTIEAFERKMTKLEGGIASVACASGMAALSNAFLNILKAGDEIVSAAGLYGGTVELFHDLEAFGIKTRYVRENTREAFAEQINEKTRVVFAETIGNPKLDVTDIRAVAEAVHEHQIPFIVDNTTATACLVRPLALGADIVVNSSSKYINGHSNAISGILTYGGNFKWTAERYPGLAPYLKFGKMAYIAKLRNGLFRNIGACLSPQNAFLNQIGLETLGLRMERQCDNALALAKHLQGLNADITVNYPGLKDNPDYELATEQFCGRYGAILTFRAGSKERAYQIINSLKLPLILSNIGDTKTLVLHPASTIGLHLSDKEKESSGIYEDLIRVSVGIEDIADLKQDFENAIKGEN